MPELHFRKGMDSALFASYARALDQRDGEFGVVQQADASLDPSVRYTTEDPNCIDHELPDSVSNQQRISRGLAYLLRPRDETPLRATPLASVEKLFLGELTEQTREIAKTEWPIGTVINLVTGKPRN